MLDLVYLCLSAIFFALMGAYARFCGRLWKDQLMFEPALGLSVAVLLGAYLLYTLLHPEKFW